MPNPIKYTTGSESLALKKGNFYIGTGDVGKGPSDVTGYYQGVSPSGGGYVIYMNKPGAPGDLSYHNATNDSELISFTNNLAGTSYTTVQECLVYYASQTDKVCLNRDYESIVTNGLVLDFDAGFSPSYPTSGTTICDLSGSGLDGGLINGPTYNSNVGGSIVFDGVDDYISLQSSLNSLNGLSGASLNIWLRLNSSRNSSGISGLIQLSGFDTTNGNLYFYTDSARVGGIWLDIFRTDRLFTGDWAPIFNPTNWHMLTVTTTPGTNGWKMYLNGSLRYQTTGQGTVSVNSNIGSFGFMLGRNSNSRDLWGNISNCFIYNRSLSSSEVLQNYQVMFPRFLGENIVTSGLVLYVDAGYNPSYPGTGTTWSDVSGNGNNGTLVNGPTFDSANGGSIVFDGVDDFVNFGSSVSLLNFIYTNSFSTEVWMRWDGGSQPNNAGHLIGKTYGNYRSFLITDTNPGRITFRLDSNGQTTDTGNIISPNLWYHVVCTWNPTTFNAKVFVNGVERASTTNTLTDWTITSGNFQIGNSPGENYYFNGNISIGRVYNNTLSPTEILQNFNAQKARFGL
jgi:hypothetical protein